MCASKTSQKQLEKSAPSINNNLQMWGGTPPHETSRNPRRARGSPAYAFFPESFRLLRGVLKLGVTLSGVGDRGGTCIHMYIYIYIDTHMGKDCKSEYRLTLMLTRTCETEAERSSTSPQNGKRPQRAAGPNSLTHAPSRHLGTLAS